MARSTRILDNKSRTVGAQSRRTHRERKPALNLLSQKRTRSVYAPPPVLVRNEQPGLAPMARSKGKNRRRYDVALSVPGAEVRLPSLPALGFSWRILSGLMTAALIGLAYFLWTSPKFQVQSAELRGLERITPNDVETIANVSGEQIFSVDASSLRTNLLAAFPDTSAITVEVKLPASVIITVAERKPVLTWRNGDKELWVDADGATFQPRGDAGTLPVVEVDNLPEVKVTKDGPQNARIDPALVQAILNLTSRAPENAVIRYNGEHGLGWKDVHGWDVYLGADLSNIDVKLNMIETLTDKLSHDGIEPEYISVEHLNSPYYHVGH